MWVVVVVGFMSLVAGLIDWAAGRGQQVPWPMLVAPHAFLLVAVLGGIAEFEQGTDRQTRAPATQIAAALRAHEGPRVLLSGHAIAPAGEPYAYQERYDARPMELKVRLADGVVRALAPRIYGEQTYLDTQAIRADAALLVEARPERFTDGEWYLADADVYTWDLAEYRRSFWVERWVFAFGALGAALAMLGFGGRAAARAYRGGRGPCPAVSATDPGPSGP